MSPRLSPSELFLRAQTDERLAALAGDGHGRAFAVLVERHRRVLHAHARRLVGSERGEDVLQQSLFKAWSALERGTEVRHVAAWLHRILHTTALTELARSGHLTEPLHEELPDPRSDAVTVELRFAVRELLTNLSNLPERQRLALLGTEIEGRSRRQLAAELGLSEGAVRQLVHRARAGMRSGVAAVVPFPVVERVMRGHGWLESGGVPVALHPTVEMAAATVAGGTAVKAGTALLVVGALGGGLVWHDTTGRHHHLRTASTGTHARPAPRHALPRTGVLPVVGAVRAVAEPVVFAAVPHTIGRTVLPAVSAAAAVGQGQVRGVRRTAAARVDPGLDAPLVPRVRDDGGATGPADGGGGGASVPRDASPGAAHMARGGPDGGDETPSAAPAANQPSASNGAGAPRSVDGNQAAAPDENRTSPAPIAGPGTASDLPQGTPSSSGD